MNHNQKLALWIGGILTVLSLAAASYWSAAILAVVTGIAWWKLDTRGKRPENVVVKSVNCASCGAICEPHWKTCPKCGKAL